MDSQPAWDVPQLQRLADELNARGTYPCLGPQQPAQNTHDPSPWRQADAVVIGGWYLPPWGTATEACQRILEQFVTVTQRQGVVCEPIILQREPAPDGLILLTATCHVIGWLDRALMDAVEEYRRDRDSHRQV